MFIFIRHILLMLMGCVITSCGNEVAFEHPTPEDLREAREALGLPAISQHTLHDKKLAVQSLQPNVNTESLIPNLSPELKVQRAAYIEKMMSKQTQQTHNYYIQLGITPSDTVQLRQLTREHYGTDWDIRNIPAGTPPATITAMKEDYQKLRNARMKTSQKIMKPYQDAVRSQTAVTGFNQTTYRQSDKGPEIPITDIIPVERSQETRDRTTKFNRQVLQKQMDEAGISLTQSNIDEYLRLQDALHDALQRSRKARKLKGQGENVTRATQLELNKNQSSIRQNLNKITAPLQEAIRVKREPELRVKQIEQMRRRYEHQNKFPSSYDLESIYDIQKALKDLNRELSIAAQNQQKTGQGSSSNYQELNKSYTEKKTELQRQRREIEARIR